MKRDRNVYSGVRYSRVHAAVEQEKIDQHNMASAYNPPKVQGASMRTKCTLHNPQQVVTNLHSS